MAKEGAGAQPVEAKKYRMRTEVSGLMPVTDGVVPAVDLQDFVKDAIKAGAATISFNHDEADRLVGIAFSVEVV
ncbi:hypothetical protein [Umezawaea sp. NPDC059074]|uniref:hypothetical protein n=1 Tax=Umezawaea sp. NPDC059074 TaxID=3346716 RepID=UPI0036BCFF7D